jgi:hypothetical protein
VHELFRQCVEAATCEDSYPLWEELQVEFHDHIFDPRAFSNKAASAGAAAVESLMAQAVKRAGLYASPQTVYSAALRIIVSESDCQLNSGAATEEKLLELVIYSSSCL